MHKRLHLFTALLTGALVLSAVSARALISPTSQAEATTWLQIEVEDVRQTDDVLHARARIKEIYKTDQELAVGDAITITYKLEAPAHPAERRLGPGSTPPLRKDSIVYAFLDRADDAGIFKPGAGVWSFAPPFGIPERERDARGMSLPTPPATPPPPPPPNALRPPRPSPATPVAPPLAPPPPPPSQ